MQISEKNTKKINFIDSRCEYRKLKRKIQYIHKLRYAATSLPLATPAATKTQMTKKKKEKQFVNLHVHQSEQLPRLSIGWEFIKINLK